MANRSRPSVYVRPIPPGVREVDLREKFRPFGDIKDIYQPLDHRTRTPRNYAYIEFVNVEDAERAILDAHNTDLKGARLSVEWARGERKSAVDMLVRAEQGHGQRPGAAPGGMGPVVDRRGDPYAPRSYDSRGDSRGGYGQPRPGYGGGRSAGPASWEGAERRGGYDYGRGYDSRDDPRRGREDPHHGPDRRSFGRGYDRRDDPRSGMDRWGGGRGGYDRRDDSRGGYDRRDDSRGGYDRRDDARGGYDRRDDARGGYDRRDDARGGYDRRDDARGGYDRRDDARGGYDRRDDARGGYDRRDDARGGYDRRGGSQDQRSSSLARDEDRCHDGGSRSALSPKTDSGRDAEQAHGSQAGAVAAAAATDSALPPNRDTSGAVASPAPAPAPEQQVDPSEQPSGSPNGGDGGSPRE
ncbi:hypothetical protein FNF29_07800 [Cafeteria roenbergensis]|uniref:RRM domain-containing protein n=1 Tax=Cafeteria roenbergensis TaxID=33653 RepID=A0A5A8C227_CAFRO|nr:hypothetical protein FNF29_07800 [Cafeteria roenbergensis]|eukprot:KAA0146824.1 hypothetical protein FNF29_07800 [Cafeteria roenbergensis]